MRKGEATQAFRNLNWEKHHLPTLGILLVEPDRKKTLNWSKKKRLLAKRMLYSSSSLTWKRPRGNRQFSHLFIGWKGPRDDKTQNTHVLNSRASLGTSENKMADKHRGLQLFSGRKNVLRKLLRIPYRRLKAGFSVCWLRLFWMKCTRSERLLLVKHFYLTCLLFFVAWKLLWIQNNQC